MHEYVHIYDWILMHTYVRPETGFKKKKLKKSNLYFLSRVKSLKTVLAMVGLEKFLCTIGLYPENGEIFLAFLDLICQMEGWELKFSPRQIFCEFMNF